MKYTAKRFSVPASAGNAAYCAEHGHTMPDIRGNCVRCGNAAPWYELTLLNTTVSPQQKTRGIPCS